MILHTCSAVDGSLRCDACAKGIAPESDRLVVEFRKANQIFYRVKDRDGRYYRGVVDGKTSWSFQVAKARTYSTRPMTCDVLGLCEDGGDAIVVRVTLRKRAK